MKDIFTICWFVLAGLWILFLLGKEIISIVRKQKNKDDLLYAIADLIVKHCVREVPIKIKLVGNGTMPKQQHEGDAAYDCYARVDEPVCIGPGEVKIIPLGFCMELPDNWHADVRPRSGLAAKKHVVAQLGLIDEPYRNEVGGIISNFGKENLIVNPNDRICQILCVRNDNYKFVEAEELSETDRGEGFGSSGV